MPYVDIAFRLIGHSIPVDHGYGLYAAVSRAVPLVHQAPDVGLHPVRGLFAGNGTLLLTPRSRLILRVPDTRIHLLLPIAGKLLDVDGCKLRAGVPEIRALTPAPTLYARLATIKGFMEAGPFLEAARRQLRHLDVTADLRVGHRKTFRIKARQIVAFEVLAIDLTPEQSLRLQETGIGGRRRMGCGLFVPVGSTSSRSRRWVDAPEDKP